MYEVFWGFIIFQSQLLLFLLCVCVVVVVVKGIVIQIWPFVICIQISWAKHIYKTIKMTSINRIVYIIICTWCFSTIQNDRCHGWILYEWCNVTSVLITPYKIWSKYWWWYRVINTTTHTPHMLYPLVKSNLDDDDF